MNHTQFGPSAVAAALAATLISLCPVTTALAADVARAPAAGAALVGGALPGGAVISARSVAVAPVAGGPTTAVPIAADGSFSAAGLAPGPYRLAVTSVTVPRQTQGATFGEKVNAGLHAAGSAISQGASLVGGASPAAGTATGQAARASDSMPSRISMNVTVGKQTQRAIVDDSVIAVEVGTDGTLAGRVAAP
jgi:hypothetical protein